MPDLTSMAVRMGPVETILEISILQENRGAVFLLTSVYLLG